MAGRLWLTPDGTGAYPDQSVLTPVTNPSNLVIPSVTHYQRTCTSGSELLHHAVHLVAGSVLGCKHNHGHVLIHQSQGPMLHLPCENPLTVHIYQLLHLYSPHHSLCMLCFAPECIASMKLLLVNINLILNSCGAACMQPLLSGADCAAYPRGTSACAWYHQRHLRQTAADVSSAFKRDLLLSCTAFQTDSHLFHAGHIRQKAAGFMHCRGGIMHCRLPRACLGAWVYLQSSFQGSCIIVASPKQQQAV